MSNANNVHMPDFRGDLPPADSSRELQFSLASIFVVMTVMAIILSAYFGVGRLLGMSTTEVLAEGFRNLLFVVPVLLVWFVGLTIAIRRLKRNRLPAILTIISLGGLVVITVVLQIVQMALVHWVNSGRMGHYLISWGFMLLGAAHAILHTACWVLVLIAIFVRRSPDTAKGNRTNATGDPFLRNGA